MEASFVSGVTIVTRAAIMNTDAPSGATFARTRNVTPSSIFQRTRRRGNGSSARSVFVIFLAIEMTPAPKITRRTRRVSECGNVKRKDA